MPHIRGKCLFNNKIIIKIKSINKITLSTSNTEISWKGTLCDFLSTSD